MALVSPSVSIKDYILKEVRPLVMKRHSDGSGGSDSIVLEAQHPIYVASKAETLDGRLPAKPTNAERVLEFDGDAVRAYYDIAIEGDTYDLVQASDDPVFTAALGAAFNLALEEIQKDESAKLSVVRYNGLGIEVLWVQQPQEVNDSFVVVGNWYPMFPQQKLSREDFLSAARTAGFAAENLPEVGESGR